MNPRLDIKPLLEDDDLAVWFHEGTSNRLVVSFSGIDGKTVAVPGPVFARSASDHGKHHVLFISDPKRTWLNGEGLVARIADLIDEARKACGATETGAVGTSMGAFAALYMAGVTEIDTVLALSPQFSIHPEVVGEDKRWWYFRKYISEHRVRTAMDRISETTTYHIVHGGDVSEAAQRDPFPHGENIHHWILPGRKHLFPERLKEMGLLHDGIVAGLNNDAAALQAAWAQMGIQKRTALEVSDA